MPALWSPSLVNWRERGTRVLTNLSYSSILLYTIVLCIGNSRKRTARYDVQIETVALSKFEHPNSIPAESGRFSSMPLSQVASRRSDLFHSPSLAHTISLLSVQRWHWSPIEAYLVVSLQPTAAPFWAILFLRGLRIMDNHITVDSTDCITMGASLWTMYLGIYRKPKWKWGKL